MAGVYRFYGRDRPGDFWRAIAVNAVILAALALLVRLWPTQFLNFLGWGYSVIMLLPTVAMLARRLHAAGRGTIWLFCCWCRRWGRRCCWRWPVCGTNTRWIEPSALARRQAEARPGGSGVLYAFFIS